VKDYEQCTADEVALVHAESVSPASALRTSSSPKRIERRSRRDDEALAGLKSGADADAADHAAFLKSLEDEQSPTNRPACRHRRALAATEAGDDRGG
jgi:hypothetical protein